MSPVARRCRGNRSVSVVSVSIEIGNTLEAMVAGDMMTRSANGRAAFELQKESR